jgi:hypothetical protein
MYTYFLVSQICTNTIESHFVSLPRSQLTYSVHSFFTKSKQKSSSFSILIPAQTKHNSSSTIINCTRPLKLFKLQDLEIGSDSSSSSTPRPRSPGRLKPELPLVPKPTSSPSTHPFPRPPPSWTPTPLSLPWLHVVRCRSPRPLPARLQRSTPMPFPVFQHCPQPAGNRPEEPATSHRPHPCGAPATAIPNAEASPSARPPTWRAWTYGATSLRTAAPAGAWCHRDWEDRRQGGSADEIVLGMIRGKLQEYGLPRAEEESQVAEHSPKEDGQV